MIINANPARLARSKVLEYTNRIGITNQNSINALVVFFESLFSGISINNFAAIYPLMGGRADFHALNFLNNNFNIIWNGANLVHDSNGVTGSTTNAGASNGNYGDTLWNPVSNASINSFHLMVYNRTTLIDDGTMFAGWKGTTGATSRLNLGRNTNAVTMGQATANADILIAVNAGPNFGGAMTVARTASGASSGSFRGTNSTSSTAVAVTTTTKTVTLLARNAEDSSFPDLNSQANLSFASIGSSLTPAQQLLYHTLVQTLQTNLGRGV